MMQFPKDFIWGAASAAYQIEGYDMFDEMVARIQLTTISILLKVKVEVRPAAPAPKAQSAVPARRFRRQMPEPLTNMSSFKQQAAKVQENKNGEQN